jgi:hypothetical protein
MHWDLVTCLGVAAASVWGYAKEVGLVGNPVPAYDIDLAQLVLYTGYDISQACTN